jgi:hypothetical protein
VPYSALQIVTSKHSPSEITGTAQPECCQAW